MTLSAVMIGVLAETPIHPGAGQSGGTIDLPVAREGGTHYPFVPGSSNKGSTKQQAGGAENFYGTADKQGDIMFGDLRLLLLPLRSSHGAYKWATCPHLLERFARDLERAGYDLRSVKVPDIREGHVLAADAKNEPLLLEEMNFTVQDALDPAAIAPIARLLPDAGAYARTRARLDRQLLVMRDDDFAWFARFGLPVHAHNVLKEGTKTSTNLWYEEALPTDTLLYSIMAPRSGRNANDAATALEAVLAKVRQQKWFQFGGNETTGQGICRLHVLDKRAAPAS